MPAQGGNAQASQLRRTAAQNQRPVLNRALQRGGYSQSQIQRSTQSAQRAQDQLSVLDVHGNRFDPTSELERRAHRPGEAPGSYDPRFAATGQRWSAATHTARDPYSTPAHNRWWETGEVALSPGTDITYSQWTGGDTVVPGQTTSEAYRRLMNERWGMGGWDLQQHGGELALGQTYQSVF